MTTRLSRMAALAETLRVALTESATKDCTVVSGIRREIYRPYDLVLVREHGTIANAKSAAEAAGFTAMSEDPTPTADYHWRLYYKLSMGESTVKVVVICALSGEYSSYEWYYTGGRAEQIKVDQEAVKQGYRSCDEHGLDDAGGGRSTGDETAIYTQLYGAYIDPPERLN
jgi:DNA polymerase/3'-5' exonuclease PolX